MKMPLLRLVLFTFTVVLSSCSLVVGAMYRIPIKPRVEDYHPFVVTEHKDTDTSLQIHGFIMSSGHLTSAVRTRLAGTCLQVDLWAVGATYVKKKRLGDLAIEFTVPDSVDEVRVGRDSVLVWDRKNGSRFPLSKLKHYRPKGNRGMTISKEEHLRWCRWIDSYVMVTPDKISVTGKFRY